MLTAIRRAWPFVAMALAHLGTTAAGSQAANGGKGSARPSRHRGRTRRRASSTRSFRTEIASGETQAVGADLRLADRRRRRGEGARQRREGRAARAAIALLVGTHPGPARAEARLASTASCPSGSSSSSRPASRSAGRTPTSRRPRPESRTRRRSGRRPTCRTARRRRSRARTSRRSRSSTSSTRRRTTSRRLERRLRRRGLDRLRPRRRHRLGPPRPARHVADVVQAPTPRSRLERLADGVRPVRHAQSCSPRPSSSTRACPGTRRRRRSDVPGRRDKRAPARCSSRRAPARRATSPRRTARTTHTYTFPTRVDEVRHGPARQPSGRLPARAVTASAPAFLVTDPNTAGVYDTVYVDLDDDYDFSDEKPVTKARRRPYRDMNGDGYTDLSGGLLVLHLRRHRRALPGRPRRVRRGVRRRRRARCWPGRGDYDPGIEGHGTLTASNVVGQGVVNGNAPTFADLPGDGTYPGAVLGGAPKAKLAPMGDIYFSFDFSTQFGYFLTTAERRRRDVELLRLAPTSTTTASTPRARRRTSSTPASTAPHDADLLDRQRRPGLRHDDPADARHRASASARPRSSAAPAGTRSRTSASRRQRRRRVVEPRPRRDRASPGVDLVADGSYSAGDATLNTVARRPRRVGDVGRHQPLDARAGRRDALVYQAYEAGACRRRADAHAGASGSSSRRRTTSATTRARRAPARSTRGGRSRPRRPRGDGLARRSGAPASYRGASTRCFTHLIAPGGGRRRRSRVTRHGHVERLGPQPERVGDT